MLILGQDISLAFTGPLILWCLNGMRINNFKHDSVVLSAKVVPPHVTFLHRKMKEFGRNALDTDKTHASKGQLIIKHDNGSEF